MPQAGSCPSGSFLSADLNLRDAQKYDVVNAEPSGRFVFQRAFGRTGFAGAEIGGVAKQRRAIGADDLVVVAEIEEDVRMIERRVGPDAHELTRADFDDGNAGIVLKVWDDV